MQVFVQHWAASVHACPVATQAPLAHAPLTHEALQHSESLAHAAPGFLQNVDDRHTEPTQLPQHGTLASHGCPAATHCPPVLPSGFPPSVPPGGIPHMQPASARDMAASGALMRAP